jgi:hypothetical protein
MKTKFITVGAAIAAILFLFTSCDQKKQTNDAKAKAEESQRQSEQEYSLTLSQSGGDPVKARVLLEQKSLQKKLESITTYSTPSGQKLHYFPDPSHTGFFEMLNAYTALHSDEVIVSIAGDTAGTTSNTTDYANVARNAGYFVVTEKVKP